MIGREPPFTTSGRTDHGDWRRRQAPAGRRLRATLRGIRRHLLALGRSCRTRDRTVIDNLTAFVDGRHLHTFVLDNRAIVAQIDSIATDVDSVSPEASELLRVLRSYLAQLDGVLVIEPPSFGFRPRQMDLRCVAFGPEIKAFVDRIEYVITAG